MEDPLRAILGRVAPGLPLESRIERLSGQFLGCRYLAHPLPDRSDGIEGLNVNFTAFDCVTFCETVLALAASGAAADFTHHLRQLRYAGSEARWSERNHYFSEWIRSNIRKTYLQGLPELHHAVAAKTLSVVKALPARPVTLRVSPHREILAEARRLRTGDVVAFVPPWESLDVFHCGLLIPKDGDLILRHASRSRGGVSDEPLAAFLSRVKLRGTIVARPRRPAFGPPASPLRL